jgi:magnesium and cobalt transporter
MRSQMQHNPHEREDISGIGPKPRPNFFQRVKALVGNDRDGNASAESEKYFSGLHEAVGDTQVSAQERALISNILNLRDVSVLNVMVPRADIVALDVGTTTEGIMALLGQKQFSRIPVYRETLDDVLGTIHIKDIVAALARNEPLDIQKLITEIPIVSPAMSILDLLLEMRESNRHIALVVDEYGGIDGLVTINDIIESIVGEIDDEHDTDESPAMKVLDDASVIADSRVTVESFEERFGPLFTDDERAGSDTLGGLVSLLAGRVPARGEVLPHASGLVFEVMDADPRRIKRLKIRNIPAR